MYEKCCITEMILWNYYLYRPKGAEVIILLLCVIVRCATFKIKHLIKKKRSHSTTCIHKKKIRGTYTYDKGFKFIRNSKCSMVSVKYVKYYDISNIT